MSQPLIIDDLPYQADSTALFECLRHEPYAVFLDSGRPYSSQGRYDIMAAAPRKLIRGCNGDSEVIDRRGHVIAHHRGDPLTVLQSHFEPLRLFVNHPFIGGAIGYFAYDLGRSMISLPPLARDSMQLPEMLVGLYDWAVVVDHSERRTVLIGLATQDREAMAEFSAVHARLIKGEHLSKQASHNDEDFVATSDLRANMSRAEYLQKFNTVLTHIRAGDCYQVNLAQRFSVTMRGSPWQGYKQLRCINPAPFSAYMECGDFVVMSISPERFLRVQANHVMACPIKGTRPRSAEYQLDYHSAEALRKSDKDRAENLMIVDLLRNDISQCCQTGSVRVSQLFAVKSFANVHHLVSTIEGDLLPQHDACDILRACFPGGSITGAPKRRVMEIIESLEPDRRSIYCGAIGYLSRHGDMDLNIAIRTAIYHRGVLHFYAGGGIVADSQGDSEYQETLSKVSSWFSLIQKRPAMIVS